MRGGFRKLYVTYYFRVELPKLGVLLVGAAKANVGHAVWNASQ